MGVLILGVNVYYKAQFGTFVSVLNTGVFSIENRKKQFKINREDFISI